MSTIASPRPSFTLSSRRGSASTDNTILSNNAGNKPNTSNAAVDRATLRRNRAALRDYYNLKATTAASTTEEEHSSSLSPDQESELDQPNFSPETYVQSLLSSQSLEGILRVEAGLLSDIRSLDGEKKALVYDNYSKLIAATDTIKSMREKMDPLTPTTSTLTPAIGHIAETAAGLRRSLAGNAAGGEAMVRRKEQKDVVRWVLDSPGRIKGLVEKGEADDARGEWRKVEEVLQQWDGIRGVEGVRKGCLEALESPPEG